MFSQVLRKIRQLMCVAGGGEEGWKWPRPGIIKIPVTLGIREENEASEKLRGLFLRSRDKD